MHTTYTAMVESMARRQGALSALVNPSNAFERRQARSIRKAARARVKAHRYEA